MLSYPTVNGIKDLVISEYMIDCNYRNHISNPRR